MAAELEEAVADADSGEVQQAGEDLGEVALEGRARRIGGRVVRRGTLRRGVNAIEDGLGCAELGRDFEVVGTTASLLAKGEGRSRLRCRVGDVTVRERGVRDYDPPGDPE